MSRKPSIKPVKRKSLIELKHEWDRIAEIRHEQIFSGKDLSHRYILVPLVLDLIKGCDLSQVLDLGCGTGELTQELAKISSEIVGIDLSEKSVEIAKEICSECSNASFHTTSVEDFARQWKGNRFTVVVANMTLMTCLHLSSFTNATGDLLQNGGYFIATVTHPWFWPQYWGYSTSDWFRYDQETIIEAPFNISLEKTLQITTHVHRPLSTYINTLSRSGFSMELVREPFPEKEIQKLYPTEWQFPRFLGFRCLNSGRHKARK